MVDYTRYDPRSINQEGLAQYGIINHTQPIPGYDDNGYHQQRYNGRDEQNGYKWQNGHPSANVPYQPSHTIARQEKRLTKHEKKKQEKLRREKDSFLMQDFQRKRTEKIQNRRERKAEKKQYNFSAKNDWYYPNRDLQFQHQVPYQHPEREPYSGRRFFVDS